MLINKDIVLEIEKKTKCPILEMFYTKDDGYWYVCFEEDIVVEGINQVVHLDDVLEELKQYENIEQLTNNIYNGEEENSYFEQITFEWKE